MTENEIKGAITFLAVAVFVITVGTTLLGVWLHERLSHIEKALRQLTPDDPIKDIANLSYGPKKDE